MMYPEKITLGACLNLRCELCSVQCIAVSRLVHFTMCNVQCTMRYERLDILTNVESRLKTDDGKIDRMKLQNL